MESQPQNTELGRSSVQQYQPWTKGRIQDFWNWGLYV